MDTLATLLKMREILADPSAWTKNVAARNAIDNVVHPASARAVCWCLEGALAKAGGCTNDDYQTFRRLITGTRAMSEFNDDPATTHADVLAALDRAIEAERLNRARAT